MPKSFSILIADDVPLMRLMFAKYVGSSGKNVLEPITGPVDLTVVEACDGEEATRHLAEHDFDLLFLDLMMPGKDGLTLLKELRADSRYDNLRVVVCSAVGEREVVASALSAGAQAYIVKPFTLESVREKLEEIYSTDLTT